MRHEPMKHLLLAAALTLIGCSGDDSSTGDTATTSGTTAGTTTASTTEGTSDTTTTEGTSTESTTTTTAGTASDSDSSSTTSSETTSTTGGDASFCQEACASDDDCTINGADLGFTCQDGRCAGESSGCAGDDECVAQYSGWAIECGSQMECPGQVCIDIGGGDGRCATAPSDILSCDTLLLEEAMYPPIEGGEPLTVCAQTAAQCSDGACRLNCTSDASCLSPSAPVCNTNTGDCECATDDHCADVPGASVCVEGQCRCASDADCEDVDNGDVCQDGACGCSSVRACGGDPAFDGTMLVCE
ncbi:MAG: hypothetical protein R3B09_25515 [Nannocystaceae bacterium]